MLRKNFVKSRNRTELQQPTCSSESVEKFMIAEIGCIDDAAVRMVKRWRQRAKFRFRGNKTVAKIWQFFKMTAVRHLVMLAFGQPAKGTWWLLSLFKIWLESTQ